jgi:propanol-preferring alcohol dehydrogenase
MKAAVVHHFKDPLNIEDVPTPKISKPNEILVHIKACGVCHTDLHAACGDWPVKPNMPLIPGHEGVGEIVEIGEQIKHLKIGDRVGIPFLYTACGFCEHCLEGVENLCINAQFCGYHVDGGYADYCLADGNYVVKIPNELNYIEAAPLFCAGVTSYKALKVSQAKPGDWVAIFGIGGLGHLAVQYAIAMGLNVIAIDTGENRKKLSLSLGASFFIDFKQDTPEEKIPQLINQGTHAAICTAVSKQGFNSACKSIRKNGTCVLVGLPPDDIPLSIFNTVLNGIHIVGSLVGTRKDLQECLDFAAKGKVKTELQVKKLEDINDIFDDMQTGKLTGRIVLDMEN